MKLRRLICLSFLLWIIVSPPPTFPHCLSPTMTHLAYVRIYLTPKNKKRIIRTTTNKTLSYPDMSGSCFPASGGPFDAAPSGESHGVKSLDAKLSDSPVYPEKVPVGFTHTISYLDSKWSQILTRFLGWWQCHIFGNISSNVVIKLLWPRNLTEAFYCLTKDSIV